MLSGFLQELNSTKAKAKARRSVDTLALYANQELSLGRGGVAVFARGFAVRAFGGAFAVPVRGRARSFPRSRLEARLERLHEVDHLGGLLGGLLALDRFTLRLALDQRL